MRLCALAIFQLFRFVIFVLFADSNLCVHDFSILHYCNFEQFQSTDAHISRLRIFPFRVCSIRCVCTFTFFYDCCFCDLLMCNCKLLRFRIYRFSISVISQGLFYKLYVFQDSCFCDFETLLMFGLSKSLIL